MQVHLVPTLVVLACCAFGPAAAQGPKVNTPPAPPPRGSLSVGASKSDGSSLSLAASATSGLAGAAAIAGATLAAGATLSAGYTLAAGVPAAVCGSVSSDKRKANIQKAKNSGYTFFDTSECEQEFLKKKQAGCQEEYTRDKFLGHGFFGEVHKATHIKTKKVVALKCKLKGSDKMLIREYCKQKNAKHPYILEVYELTCRKNSPCIAMELATHGSLLDVVGKHKEEVLLEDEAKHYFKQWAEGVAYMHALGMANRDIKPENVLLVDKTVKMCDFGIACYSCSPFHSYNCHMNSLMGTPGYKPDDLRNFLQTQEDARARDVYALGMSWRELMTGVKPTMIQMFDSKQVQRRCGMSYELTHLISKMINPNPDKRLTIAQVLDHPWMKGDKIPQKGDDKQREDRWNHNCELVMQAKGSTLEPTKSDLIVGTNKNTEGIHELELLRAKFAEEKASKIDGPAPPTPIRKSKTVN